MCNHSEKARALFHEGYNCAQSVFLAFSEDLELDFETAAKLSSSFGGGMGRLREVCGAVSAMFMIAGLRKGYTAPNDDAVKAEHYHRIQALAAEFREHHGTILCRELLGLGDGPDDYQPSKRTEAHYASRPCADLVADAAAIVDAWIAAGKL